MDPNPQLLTDAPIELLESRTLFRSPSARRHGCGSIRRLSNGRLLMAFMAGTGPEHVNDGAVMLTWSDDEGRTWDEPFPVYAVPGWDSLPLGGIAHISDDLLQLVVGRVRYEPSLGGDEPFGGWFMGLSINAAGSPQAERVDVLRLYDVERSKKMARKMAEIVEKSDKKKK